MTDNGSLIIYDGDCIFCHPKLGRLMALLLRGRSLMTPPSLKPEHPQDGFVSLTAIRLRLSQPLLLPHRGFLCGSRFLASSPLRRIESPIRGRRAWWREEMQRQGGAGAIQNH